MKRWWRLVWGLANWWLKTDKSNFYYRQLLTGCSSFSWTSICKQNKHLVHLILRNTSFTLVCFSWNKITPFRLMIQYLDLKSELEWNWYPTGADTMLLINYMHHMWYNYNKDVPSLIWVLVEVQVFPRRCPFPAVSGPCLAYWCRSCWQHFFGNVCGCSSCTLPRTEIKDPMIDVNVLQQTGEGQKWYMLSFFFLQSME